jgi:xanthine dehydrogenase molybdopterin-binding subunit B
MPNDYQTIGKREKRKDSISKTNGTALYTADIKLENTLWASIFRSSQHAGMIINLDISAAADAPGVVKVITGKDIPGEKTFGALLSDQPPLAVNEVRHIGEPIALMIAHSQKIAEEAKKKIQIEYEPLSPIFDPQQAIVEGA